MYATTYQYDGVEALYPRGQLEEHYKEHATAQKAIDSYNTAITVLKLTIRTAFYVYLYKDSKLITFYASECH